MKTKWITRDVANAKTSEIRQLLVAGWEIPDIARQLGVTRQFAEKVWQQIELEAVEASHRISTCTQTPFDP
jgi:hypothetical protein